MTNPQSPYVLYGVVYDGNNTALANTAITVYNDSSGDTLTATTNGSGQYVIDCANFTRGYLSGDKITVAVTEVPVWEHWISIDGGLNWQQVEYNTNTLLVYNTVRFKHSATYYPGGRTFNIIKSA